MMSSNRGNYHLTPLLKLDSFSLIKCFCFALLFSDKSCNSYNNNNSKIMLIITTRIMKNSYYFSIYNVTDIDQALYTHDII